MTQYVVTFKIAGRDAALDERFDTESEARSVAAHVEEQGVGPAQVLTAETYEVGRGV